MGARSHILTVLLKHFHEVIVLVVIFLATGIPVRAAQTLPVLAPTILCADLVKADLSDIGGAGSHVLQAAEATSNGITTCSVTGLLAPAINFSAVLPTATWTQRYLQVGCGGLCGNVTLNIGAAYGCEPLTNGEFVIAATDMGHQDQDGSFGLDPQKSADFAYRAQHLTALAVKKLIKSYYGQDPAFSYFAGCSDGGREALIEAQRFPNDFDGITAGAAALNFETQNGMYHAWQARSNMDANGTPILTAPRMPILHAAVVAACDKLDGLEDGLISNPLACSFDPKTVQCAAGVTETSTCFTALEVEAAHKLYDGPHDPSTGQRLTIGGPQFGSELAWIGVFVPNTAQDDIFSERITTQAFDIIYGAKAPKDLASVKFQAVTFDLLRARHPLLDATNPDLSAFKDSGGKLILWHGWSDPHISPLNTIAYYQSVKDQMGATTADSFSKLYLFPGVEHCSNGEGPYQFDLLTPILDWVESGVAPDKIMTYQPDVSADSAFGQPTGGMHNMPEAAALPEYPPVDAIAEKISRSRPVYPYPYSTAYDGKNDPTQASSFSKGDAVQEFTMPDWAGKDFFQPYGPSLIVGTP